MSKLNQQLNSLPLGFAEQLLELQMKFEEDQSIELVQILSQMYRIAVEYYINIDVKKAGYFQRKMNKLALKSLNVQCSLERVKNQKKRKKLTKQIKQQINKYSSIEKTYLKSIIENKQKNQKKKKDIIQADLNQQEEKFKTRMMRRVKSTHKC